ncbi:MAG: type II secretion system protein J, partial [Acidiferrobacterales bacterium]
MRTSGIPFQRTGIAGFTLLELIIALVILSTMLMLLFNGLRLGARAWDTVEERTTALQDAHLGQLLIRRQLEQAHALTLEGEDGERRITFFGDSRSVR